MKTRTRSTAAPVPVFLPATRANRAAVACLLAVPILMALADILRMVAEGDSHITGGAGAAPDMVPVFESLAAHRPVMAAATILVFLTAFVAMSAVGLLWRLGAAGSPWLAWTVLVLGIFFVLGRVVHTLVYFGAMLYFSTAYAPAQAAALNDSFGGFWVVNMAIVPTVLGLALWLPLSGAMLWRLHAVPRWAGLFIIAGTGMLVALGSSFATTVAMGVLTVAGLVPLALRGRARRLPAAKADAFGAGEATA